MFTWYQVLLISVDLLCCTFSNGKGNTYTLEHNSNTDSHLLTTDWVPAPILHLISNTFDPHRSPLELVRSFSLFFSLGLISFNPYFRALLFSWETRKKGFTSWWHSTTTSPSSPGRFCRWLSGSSCSTRGCTRRSRTRPETSTIMAARYYRYSCI